MYRFETGHAANAIDRPFRNDFRRSGNFPRISACPPRLRIESGAHLYNEHECRWETLMPKQVVVGLLVGSVDNQEVNWSRRAQLTNSRSRHWSLLGGLSSYIPRALRLSSILRTLSRRPRSSRVSHPRRSAAACPLLNPAVSALPPPITALATTHTSSAAHSRPAINPTHRTGRKILV